MRRAAILCAFLGLVVSGVGCRVVTGTCDCTYDPASATLPAPDGRSPYATVGSPVGGGVVPAPVGHAAAPMTLQDLGK